jgi:hypothetical protein
MFARVLSTTLTGLGFGLMAWLGFGLGGHSAAFAWIATAAAFGVALAGLALSPSRPTRPREWADAVAAWRRSWSARAGLFAFASLALYGAYAVPWLLFGWRITLLGVAGTAAAVAAVYATGMTYRIAENAPRWATALTPAYFVAFALASGALTDAMLTDLTARDDGGRADGAAVFLLLIAFAFRLTWRNRSIAVDAERGEETPPADTPFGRLSAVALRRMAVALGLVLPIVCIDLSGRFGALFVLIGLGSHVAGLLIERWLFMAAEPLATPELGPSPAAKPAGDGEADED